MNIQTIMRSIYIPLFLLVSTYGLPALGAEKNGIPAIRVTTMRARPESRFKPGDEAMVVRSKAQFKFGSRTIALLEAGTEVTVGSIGPGWVAGYVNIHGTRMSGYLNPSDIIPVAPKAIDKQQLVSLAKTENKTTITPVQVVVDKPAAKQSREHLEQALAYDRIGDHARALAGYNEALRLDPHCKQAYSARGSVFFKNGNWNHAIADFTAAIHLDPESAMNFVDRAAAYNQDGKYDLAITDCTKALQLDSHLVLAYNVRGVSYKNKGEFDQAIADCEKAIHLDPQNARAYYCCGLALASKGEHTKANENFAAARKLGYRPIKPGSE